MPATDTDPIPKKISSEDVMSPTDLLAPGVRIDLPEQPPYNRPG